MTSIAKKEVTIEVDPIIWDRVKDYASYYKFSESDDDEDWQDDEVVTNDWSD